MLPVADRLSPTRLTEVTVNQGLFGAEGYFQVEHLNLHAGQLQGQFLTGDGVIRKLGQLPAQFHPKGSDFAGTIEVHDGVLHIDDGSSSAAHIHLLGGAAALNPAEPYRVQTSLTMDGGEIWPAQGQFLGSIHVQATSTILASAMRPDAGVFSGALTGNEPLVIQGRKPRDSVAFTGDNRQYRGQWTVHSGTLIFGHQHAAGSASVTVGDEGIAQWLAEIPGGLTVDNPVSVNGGTISVDAGNSFLVHQGRIMVEQESIIRLEQGGLDLRDVELKRDSKLLIESDGQLLLDGNLGISGSTQIATLTTLRNPQDAPLAITGTVSARSFDASLQLNSRGLTAHDFQPSYRILSGAGLRITEGVTQTPIAVTLDRGLTGGGQFNNDLLVNSGAVISPDSLTLAPQHAGTLRINGDLEIHGGKYAWEISDASNPSAADLLVVQGQLQFATGHPLDLEISSNNAQGTLAPLSGFDGTKSYRWPMLQSTQELPEDIEANINFLTHSFLSPNPKARFGALSIESDASTLWLRYDFFADVDSNGNISSDELDQMCDAIRSGDNAYDFSRDGVVNQLDLQLFVRQAVNTYLGDTDLNGSVSFTDFIALSVNFGRTGGWANGDFNCSQTIDFGDFLFLSNNFGQEASQPVPEPQYGGFLWIAGLLLLRRRRPRTTRG